MRLFPHSAYTPGFRVSMEEEKEKMAAKIMGWN